MGEREERLVRFMCIISVLSVAEEAVSRQMKNSCIFVLAKDRRESKWDFGDLIKKKLEVIP